MSWTKGTDLRDKDGFYTWPPNDPDGTKYPSCTTILKKVFGVPDVAHAELVAQEAQRLFALHQAGMPAKRAKVELDELGMQQRYMDEVEPADLILEPQYLSKFGFLQGGRAAHRGTVVHEFLRRWHVEGPMAIGDVPYWTENIIVEGDGELPYRCDPDETIEYVKQLAIWLRDTGFRMVATEVPGFNDELGYAATLDAIGYFPGDPRFWIVDAKTSAQSTREHAMQLVAQRHVEFLGVPGTSDTTTYHALMGDVDLRMAQLQINVDRTVFRECDAPLEWWVAAWNMYKVKTAPMPFDTIRGASKRRSNKR